MSTRPLQILQRFPSHLEPARPDKQLWAVVEGLSEDLDVLSTDLAGVRRAHRLKDADTLRAVLLLAGMHGLDKHLLDILYARAARVRELARQLEDAVAAHDTATRDALAEDLFRLWATAASPPRLPLYAPPVGGGGPPDLDAAGTALAKAARASVTSRKLLEAARSRVRQVCEIHSQGNGTVRALLVAAANALDMDVDEAKNAEVLAEIRQAGSDTLDLQRSDGFFHSLDRYRHATFARDRLQPAPRVFPPAAPNGPPVLAPLPYDAELVGIEENPVVRHGAEVGPKPHAALFTVSRRGFEHERLQIEIKGIENRTVGPHLVNRDDGVGIGFFGAVPDGKTLLIDEDGSMILDGVDVAGLGYSWKGGCFADSSALNPRDFCFDGPGLPADKRAATFAVATPAGSLDSDAVFPHPEAALEGPGIGVGHTRFAFFVQEGCLSARVPSDDDGPPIIHRVTPHFAIAFADGSVFGTDDPAHRPDAADLKLSWLEHEAYTFKVWIPQRFQALESAEVSMLALVEQALERFRPMGVKSQVSYQDDTWILGVGVLVAPSGDPTLRILSGTVLAAQPATET